MRSVRRCGIAAFFTFMLANGVLCAQDTEPAKAPAKFYKLLFVVKEVDGTKVLNSRSYTITAATDGQHTAIRTGSKVDVFVGPPSTNNWSQVDLHIKIDCRNVQEQQNELSLFIDAEVASIAQEPILSGATPTGATISSNAPVIRNNQWGSSVLVPLRKPVVIFSSDDVTSKHQMQVELTATPLS